MLGSGFLEFKLNYSEMTNMAVGDFVRSEEISVRGHRWMVNFYPRGHSATGKGEYISIFLKLISHSRDVKTIFNVFFLGRDGEPSFSYEGRFVHVFSKGKILGWPQFINRGVLESLYVTNGWVTLVCGIIVVGDNAISVPPPEIGNHLGLLLDSSVGTDLSFLVDGETIPAHRAVLAARSPVFKAEHFGSAPDGISASITLQDMKPLTLKAMLRFMYTDELPGDDELGESSTEMMQHLLAAAERYALDRLKLMCARWLWDNISVDTFASTLACAEMYNCLELKSKCMDFFAVHNNFKKIAFTDGFMWLLEKFPSLAAKLKEMVGI
ncbi:hypothetical protein EJB05_48157, partial [Eragrostis curvula]